MADVLSMSSSVPTAADDTNSASVPQTTKPATSNKVSQRCHTQRSAAQPHNGTCASYSL